MYVYDKMGLRNDSVYSGERSCEEAEPGQGLEEATMDGSSVLKTFETLSTDKTTPVEDKAQVAMHLSRTWGVNK